MEKLKHTILALFLFTTVCCSRTQIDKRLDHPEKQTHTSIFWKQLQKQTPPPKIRSPKIQRLVQRIGKNKVPLLWVQGESEVDFFKYKLCPQNSSSECAWKETRTGNIFVLQEKTTQWHILTKACYRSRTDNNKISCSKITTLNFTEYQVLPREFISYLKETALIQDRYHKLSLALTAKTQKELYKDQAPKQFKQAYFNVAYVGADKWTTLLSHSELVGALMEELQAAESKNQSFFLSDPDSTKQTGEVTQESDNQKFLEEEEKKEEEERVKKRLIKRSGSVLLSFGSPLVLLAITGLILRSSINDAGRAGADMVQAGGEAVKGYEDIYLGKHQLLYRPERIQEWLNTVDEVNELLIEQKILTEVDVEKIKENSRNLAAEAERMGVIDQPLPDDFLGKRRDFDAKLYEYLAEARKNAVDGYISILDEHDPLIEKISTVSAARRNGLFVKKDQDSWVTSSKKRVSAMAGYPQKETEYERSFNQAMETLRTKYDFLPSEDLPLDRLLTLLESEEEASLKQLRPLSIEYTEKIKKAGQISNLSQNIQFFSYDDESLGVISKLAKEEIDDIFYLIKFSIAEQTVAHLSTTVDDRFKHFLTEIDALVRNNHNPLVKRVVNPMFYENTIRSQLLSLREVVEDNKDLFHAKLRNKLIAELEDVHKSIDIQINRALLDVREIGAKNHQSFKKAEIEVNATRKSTIETSTKYSLLAGGLGMILIAAGITAMVYSNVNLTDSLQKKLAELNELDLLLFKIKKDEKTLKASFKNLQ